MCGGMGVARCLEVAREFLCLKYAVCCVAVAVAAVGTAVYRMIDVELYLGEKRVCVCVHKQGDYI